MRFIALLRGINISGHRKIKMADLKRLMSESGFENVATIQASGNVAFDAGSRSTANLGREIGALIQEHFKLDVPTIVMPGDELTEILKQIPEQLSSGEYPTKYNVTFLDEERNQHPKFPADTGSLVATIMSQGSRYVCGRVEIRRNGDTLRYMEILDSLYGKGITTRTVGTLEKLVQA